MRAAAYLRVSNTSQVEGHSLDAQERLYIKLCKSKGWVPAIVYREEGRSAHSESIKHRPQLQQLLIDADNGEFDVVVVHTLDRWSRNLKVALDLMGQLERHKVGFVSITEQIDFSTPQGRLMFNQISSFSQFFSDQLGVHVKKGQSQRAHEGKHLGGIPFGYQSCWINKGGERKRRCDPEHPGAVHQIPEEAVATAELFKRYATGTTTLSELASWLNGKGFRTRNKRRLPDSQGNVRALPRLFTTASVRGILHNPFFYGDIKHNGEVLPGVHEAVVSKEVFDLVQASLRRKNGRSTTFKAHPAREYLLKGIIRCAYCLMPMWAQTYQNGRRYYREHRGARGHQECPAHGGSITCDAADEQVGRLIEAIELGPRWLEEVLALVSLHDEVGRVEEERKQVKGKLRRLGNAYIDGLVPDDGYNRQRKMLQGRLDSLVVPEATAAEEAGNLIRNLPQLWLKANLSEKRRLLLTMLDAVYVDHKGEKAVVAVSPKPPFKPVFRITTTRDGSGVVLVNDMSEPPKPEALTDLSCSWWRRGRVELPVQKSFQEDFYRLSR